MAQALTPPFLLAALLLCVAGAAKLRAPAAAGRALRGLGLPGPPGLVRAFAAGELALGLWSALHPGRLAAGAVAVLYGLFAVLSLALMRRRASCGCFGDGATPASPVQSWLSVGLALVALAAVAAQPPGLGWVLGRPAWELAVLMIGTGGSVYATVLAYTQVPSAWASWSAS